MFFLVILLGCSIAPVRVDRTKTVSQVEETNINVFLPLTLRAPEKFFGIYLDQYWTTASVNAYMPLADQAAGKKHSSVGWFIDLEDAALTEPVLEMWHNNLYRQLEALWQGGYVSFINLGTNATALQILNGERDSNIGYAAMFYKNWLDLGGGRIAMIAPLQEMNGDWTAYGASSSSTDLIAAYRYIVNGFYEKGVGRDQVYWVFAPNAWNPETNPDRMFENYFPGDDVVDFVGFSSYNYGFCPSTSAVSGKWETYEDLFIPAITRMEAIAPMKPMIIAETATTAYYDYDKADQNLKDQWLIDSYNYLASNKSIVGIYYFSFSNFDGKVCDFEVAEPGNFSSGYKEGLKNLIYKYFTPTDIGTFVR